MLFSGTDSTTLYTGQRAVKWVVVVNAEWTSTKRAVLTFTTFAWRITAAHLLKRREIYSVLTE